MERYETASLELAVFNEDVLTASGATNTSVEVDYTECWGDTTCIAMAQAGVTVYYTDGTAVNYGSGSYEYSLYCG